MTMDEGITTVNKNVTTESLTMHALPNELLVIILTCVYHGNLCEPLAGNLTDRGNCAKVSGTLMLVCSRWREIVMKIPRFWSHIDLLTHELNNPIHLANVQKHLALTKQVPVEIHIMDKLEPSAPLELENFCKIINEAAPRMRSLIFHQVNYSMDRSQDVLYHCLDHNTPGTLEELTIVLDDGSEDFRLFIEAEDSITRHSHPPIILKNMTVDRLEAALLSIVTLRLCGAFPYWVSKAYHGLVELCLHSKPNNSVPLEISHSSLLRILSLSPKLQVLDLDIKFTAIAEGFIESVYLEDLRILRTGLMSLHQFKHFVEYLFPGPSPLTMCYRAYDGNSVASITEITAFFSRAKVERTWLRSSHPYMDPRGLGILKLAPHTRELALSQLPFYNMHARIQADPGDYQYHIDTLYLLPPCKISISNLEQITKSFRIQKVRIHHACLVLEDDKLIPASTLQERMSSICKAIEWSDEYKPHGWGIPSFPATTRG
ncbi:hypothetical protein RHS02_03325, partial [Rhizoctonia solani]